MGAEASYRSRFTYADDGNFLDMIGEALRLLTGILLGHVV